MTTAITDSINLDLRPANDDNHPDFRPGDEFWHLLPAEGDELARLERVFEITPQALADDIILCVKFKQPMPNIARVRLAGDRATAADRLAACRADYAAAFGPPPDRG